MTTDVFKMRIRIINVDGTAAFLHISPCYENISQIVIVSEIMLKYIVCVHTCIRGAWDGMHMCMCVSVSVRFSKTVLHPCSSIISVYTYASCQN